MKSKRKTLNLRSLLATYRSIIFDFLSAIDIFGLIIHLLKLIIRLPSQRLSIIWSLIDFDFLPVIFFKSLFLGAKIAFKRARGFLGALEITAVQKLLVSAKLSSPGVALLSRAVVLQKRTVVCGEIRSLSAVGSVSFCQIRIAFHALALTEFSFRNSCDFFGRRTPVQIEMVQKGVFLFF